MALPVRSMSLTEAVDTSRTGSAWYFDENGVFQEESTSDVARIDYDPATGNRLGLMAEGASTNLLTYSEDLSNAAWTKTNVTIGTPTTFATNISLDEVVETADAGMHAVNQNPPPAAGTYTSSVFLKRKSGKRRYVYCRATAFASTTPGIYSVLVDLDDGSVVDTELAGSATVTNTGSHRVRDMGGGVYRVEITLTGTATGGGFLVGSSDTATPTWAANSLVEFTGDITESFYAGGFQLEELPGASSYIPTTSAQVTRAAETHELVSLDPWYRASGYSVAVQFVERGIRSTSPAVLSISDANGQNRVSVIPYVASETEAAVLVEAQDADEIDYLGAAATVNVASKIAVRIGASGSAASIDGNAAVSLTNTAVPSPASKVSIGAGYSGLGVIGSPMYGWIQDLKYTTELWSDAELATESGTTV